MLPKTDARLLQARAHDVLLFPRVGMTERCHGYDSAMQHEQDVTNEGGQTSRVDDALVSDLAVPSDATRGSGVDRTTSDSSAAADEQNDQHAPWLTPHRWKPGQSGNPSGRPKESGSMGGALYRGHRSRQRLQSTTDRSTLTNRGTQDSLANWNYPHQEVLANVADRAPEEVLRPVGQNHDARKLA